MGRFIISISVALLFCGCIAYDPQTSVINAYFHNDQLNNTDRVTYSGDKMNKPTNAVVIEAISFGVAPTTTEIITYEVSLAAGGVLQTIDPSFSLNDFPAQLITFKTTDGNTSTVAYGVYAYYPYTFRKDDNVTLDTNGTNFIAIRPANDNPQNLELNSSKYGNK